MENLTKKHPLYSIINKIESDVILRNCTFEQINDDIIVTRSSWNSCSLMHLIKIVGKKHYAFYMIDSESCRVYKQKI